MGKVLSFFKDADEQKRFFKYFQELHKVAGNNIPDDKLEEFFFAAKEEHDAKIDFYAEEIKRRKFAKKLYDDNSADMVGKNTFGRILTAMFKLEKTDEDKKYNQQLIEYSKTQEGVGEIYKMVAEELLSLDLKLIDCPLEQQMINWKNNSRLFGLAFIVENIRAEYSTYGKNDEKKAENIKKLTDNKAYYEAAGNARYTIDFEIHDFRPFIPENLDFIAAKSEIDKKRIGDVTFDKTNLDHKIMSEIITHGFNREFVSMNKNIGAAERTAVIEAFGKNYADFRKSYKSDKEMRDKLERMIRDMFAYVEPGEKIGAPEQEKLLGRFHSPASAILSDEAMNNISGRELYARLMRAFAGVGGEIGPNSEMDIEPELKDEAAHKMEQIKNLFNQDYKEFRKQFNNDKEMEKALGSFIKGMPADLKYYAENNRSFVENAKEQLAKVEKASKNPGKDLYDKLKGEYLKFEINIDKANVEAEYSNPENNNLKGINDSRFVDEMITLLEEGDKWYRGSSSAYKDIQSQLNDLKTLIDLRAEDKDAQVKRSIDLIMGSVLDKAQKYVKAREKNAIDYSAESYKGKRVDRMNKVIHRLQEKIASVNRESIYSEEDMNSFVPSTYKKDMKALFEDNIFSSRVLAEIIAVAPLQDNKGHLGQATFKDLMDETEKIAGSPAMTVLAGYYGESKSDVKDAITKYNSVSMHMKTYFENIKSYNKAQLSEEVEKLKKIEDANTPDKISDDKFALRYDYAGKITGDRELDAEIAKFKKNFVSAMNDRRPADKNMQNELGENRINEAGMVPVK